jgi:hypothetical protein
VGCAGAGREMAASRAGDDASDETIGRQSESNDSLPGSQWMPSNFRQPGRRRRCALVSLLGNPAFFCYAFGLRWKKERLCPLRLLIWNDQ